MTRMEKKSRNSAKRRVDALLLAVSIMIGAGFALSGCGSDVKEPAPEPGCVAEATAFWGSFDEIRLFRYYAPDTDRDAIPEDAEYQGVPYVLAGIDGPLENEYGTCVEAMYRACD